MFNVIAACLVPSAGIGLDGTIPWHVGSDLRRFRYLTSHPSPAAVIMGRKTFESLPGGRPLSGRTNVVVSETMDDQDQGIVVVRSFEDALAFVRSNPFANVHVIGGESLYRQALVHPGCARVYLTELEDLSGSGPKDCDRFFPIDLLRDRFSILASSRNIDGPYRLTFVDLVRDCCSRTDDSSSRTE
jgi:dihydrofolate reductase